MQKLRPGHGEFLALGWLKFLNLRPILFLAGWTFRKILSSWLAGQIQDSLIQLL
jgi:hypothetical protein